MTDTRWLLIPILAASIVACSTVGDEASSSGGSDPQKACAAGDTACAAAAAASSSSSSGTSGYEPVGTDPAGRPLGATDGKKNGTESDIDCGGDDAARDRCADGKACTANNDCENSVCKGGKCQAPRGDDGVKNGTESDVDCGGTNKDTERCDVAKKCKVHADCGSDGCGSDKKCVIARSCAGRFGGNTCGVGEVGEADAKHESCCETAPISAAANATQLDKYVVTAGRMRQFVERTKGNLREFGESLGAGNPNWKPEWNANLPADIDEVNFLLGPTGHGPRAGCDLDQARGRTYWMSDAENDQIDTGHHAFTKDDLDQKALNCVEFFMLQALCVWDGGRLATQAEIKAAWNGGENRTYPWGSGFDASKIVYQSNYQFPEQFDQGNFIYVAPPGRKPEGNGKFGHADLAGLVFEITSDVSGANILWSGSGSWEGHAVTAGGNAYGSTPMTRAYWATGGRCAHPQ